MIYMFLSNNPSSGDINSSNLSCFYFFFFANSTKQFFLFSPKKYRQCHQAVDPGDMYNGRC